MLNEPSPNVGSAPTRRSLARRVARGCAWGCGGLCLLFAVALALLLLMISRTPKSYTRAADPIPAPGASESLGGGLDGFDSPYVGHTGSWDGKGGGMFGSSKLGDLDLERAMGLRWTFMCVYWRALEPEGPVDLSRGVPPAWRELDAFVVAAHERGLNILMQAPVVGGNAGGPPAWAGRREPGKSAPANMAALAAFAGKLGERYRPGGTLARSQGWGDHYGVRAWELDNEPEGYFTSWKGQAADYAEFATLAARSLRAADPLAVIVGPGLAAGKHGLEWLAQTLDASAMAGSPAFRAAGVPYSLGPVADVVSFHNYEGLDSAFNEGVRTIGDVFSDVRAVFEQAEQRTPGLTYPRKREYWHTEGNFDFVGVLSAGRRAAWRFQFFTRAFAAGIRKVAVMDPTPAEQLAIRAYVSALPNPFPLLPANPELTARHGKVAAFRHPIGGASAKGNVWIIWPLAGTGDAVLDLAVRHERVTLITVTGESKPVTAGSGRVTLELKGDAKMAAGVLVLDGPGN